MANSKKRSGSRKKELSTPRDKSASADLLHPFQNIQQVSSLCRKMASSPDVKTARELRTQADALETFFGEIRRNAHQYLDSVVAELAAETKSKAAVEALGKMCGPESPSDMIEVESPLAESPLAPGGASHRQRFEALLSSPRGTRLLTEVATASTPTTLQPGQLDLDGFFQSVAKAVIDAQQTLDSMSLNYALQQQNAQLPGALYSIPNVKAEIKAGLSTEGGSGLIVSLFKDDKSTSFSDSTISFDVVASPPPPGRLDRFTTAIPRFLVVEGTDRQNVITKIAGSAGAPSDAGWQDRTVIIRDLLPARTVLGNQAFFALTPGPAPQPNDQGVVDFTHVTIAANLFEEPASLTPIPISTGAPTVFFYRLAASIGRWVASVTAAPAK